jgi:hypothetical protein
VPCRCVRQYGQCLHADQALHHLGAQAFPAGEAHVLQEVIEGVVDRQRGLRGLGQAVEVGQHRPAAVAEFKIQLAAGAELEQVQREPPPGEEPPVVDAVLLHARIREAIKPGTQLGEEMADGLDQGAASDQGRPALSFRHHARARSRATDSW